MKKLNVVVLVVICMDMCVVVGFPDNAPPKFVTEEAIQCVSDPHVQQYARSQVPIPYQKDHGLRCTVR